MILVEACTWSKWGPWEIIHLKSHFQFPFTLVSMRNKKKKSKKQKALYSPYQHLTLCWSSRAWWIAGRELLQNLPAKGTCGYEDRSAECSADDRLLDYAHVQKLFGEWFKHGRRWCRSMEGKPIWCMKGWRAVDTRCSGDSLWTYCPSQMDRGVRWLLPGVLACGLRACSQSVANTWPNGAVFPVRCSINVPDYAGSDWVTMSVRLSEGPTCSVPLCTGTCVSILTMTETIVVLYTTYYFKYMYCAFIMLFKTSTMYSVVMAHNM